MTYVQGLTDLLNLRDLPGLTCEPNLLDLQGLTGRPNKLDLPDLTHGPSLFDQPGLLDLTGLNDRPNLPDLPGLPDLFLIVLPTADRYLLIRLGRKALPPPPGVKAFILLPVALIRSLTGYLYRKR